MIDSEKAMLGLMPRKAAWDALRQVAAGAYSDVALERVLGRYSLNQLDRGLLTELTYGSIRQRYALDCWIDSFAKIPSDKQPPQLRWLLHIGLYQIIYMERIPDSAAVNTTVQLAKKGNLGSLAPVVNGFLRKVVRTINSGKNLPLPKDKTLRLAQTKSLPLWLAAELIEWRGVTQAEDIAQASNQSPPVDLRVNQLRIARDDMKNKFDQANIETDFIEGCPNGIQILSSQSDIRRVPGFNEGYWVVQDRSAQTVTPFLEPCSGEKVLDACSAPGGKTTHIAELMNDIGEVWAVDRSLERLSRLISNADRLGLESIRTFNADTSNLLELKPDWKNYFNKILLDVPCSGLGTLARHPDARWRMSMEQIDQLVDLQKKLLDSAIHLLTPGGRLVYSTCTIHPKENLLQIKRLLDSNPNLALINEVQIWPSMESLGDGFYIAVIEKY